MIFVPRTASEITGKSVPQNTEKHITTNTILLKRNPLSREVNDSILLVDRRSFIRVYMRPKEATNIKKTNVKNMGPNEEAVNECTELMTPDLVRNVPKIQRVNVRMISTIFHTRSISFFSCMIIEWTNAVAVSHGIKLAFSTGSQAQYPPQPNSR